MDSPVNENTQCSLLHCSTPTEASVSVYYKKHKIQRSVSVCTVVLSVQLIVSMLLWALLSISWKSTMSLFSGKQCPRLSLQCKWKIKRVSSLLRTWDYPFQLIQTSSLCYFSNLIFYSTNGLVKMLWDTEGMNQLTVLTGMGFDTQWCK